MIATDRPCFAACIAAPSPPGPDPITTKSYDGSDAIPIPVQLLSDFLSERGRSIGRSPTSQALPETTRRVRSYQIRRARGGRSTGGFRFESWKKTLLPPSAKLDYKPFDGTSVPFYVEQQQESRSWIDELGGLGPPSDWLWPREP
jgi:hypothetical protein